AVKHEALVEDLLQPKLALAGEHGPTPRIDERPTDDALRFAQHGLDICPCQLLGAVKRAVLASWRIKTIGRRLSGGGPYQSAPLPTDAPARSVARDLGGFRLRRLRHRCIRSADRWLARVTHGARWLRARRPGAGSA